MRPTIESPALVSRSARRRHKVLRVATCAVACFASLGLVTLIVAAAGMGNDASPGGVAVIAGVAMLPACVAGLLLTTRL
jgi:hypothetical protein